MSFFQSAAFPVVVTVVFAFLARLIWSGEAEWETCGLLLLFVLALDLTYRQGYRDGRRR